MEGIQRVYDTPRLEAQITEKFLKTKNYKEGEMSFDKEFTPEDSQPVIMLNPTQYTIQNPYRSPLEDSDIEEEENGVDRLDLVMSCKVAVPEKNGRGRGWKDQPMEDKQI